MNNYEKYVERVLYFVRHGMDISSACKYSRAIDLLGDKIFKGLGEKDKEAVINFADMCQNYITLTYCGDNYFED